MTPTEELIAAAWALVKAVESTETMGAFDEKGNGPFLALYDRSGLTDKVFKDKPTIPGPGRIATPAKRLREVLLRVEGIIDADGRRAAS